MLCPEEMLFCEKSSRSRGRDRQHARQVRSRSLFHRDRLLGFFEEFFKTGIAAKRIPEWHQFQVAIAKVVWEADDAFQLFEGEALVANPGGDQCQTLHTKDSGHCVFFHRKKLDCTPAFA